MEVSVEMAYLLRIRGDRLVLWHLFAELDDALAQARAEDLE